MNIEALLNVVRREVAKVLHALGMPRKGLVTSYDPNTYSIKAQLQPEGTETGWIPLSAEWVGNGWGMFAPPSIGDMVDIHFDEGYRQSPYASRRFFSKTARPLAVESGEFWIVHKGGQAFKMTNDGKLSASDGHGATVTLNGDGTISSQATNWQHTGNIEVLGIVTAGGLAVTGEYQEGGATITGDLHIVGDVYTTGDLVNNSTNVGSTHVHGGVDPGSGNTEGPH